MTEPSEQPIPPKAARIPTEPGVPSDRVSRGSREYWGAIREAQSGAHELAARAARIDELQQWVKRIGTGDTISEYLTNELRDRITELTNQRPLNDYTGGPARTERELQLERQVAELEEHERERIANAQHQYTEAWNAYQRLLKRMGAAAGVELPGDLRYYKYENQIIAKITDLRAAQPNT